MRRSIRCANPLGINIDQMEEILVGKRKEREEEAEKHRQELRKEAEAKAASEKKRMDEELAVSALSS